MYKANDIIRTWMGSGYYVMTRGAEEGLFPFAVCSELSDPNNRAAFQSTPLTSSPFIDASKCSALRIFRSKRSCMFHGGVVIILYVTRMYVTHGCHTCMHAIVQARRYSPSDHKHCIFPTNSGIINFIDAIFFTGLTHGHIRQNVSCRISSSASTKKRG
jgi:hypothetical protein